jgi:hypothetical protein
VAFHDVAHDPEPQSEPPIAGVAFLPETVEHIRQELAADANALIAHDDSRRALVPAQLDLDGAVVR